MSSNLEGKQQGKDTPLRRIRMAMELRAIDVCAMSGVSMIVVRRLDSHRDVSKVSLGDLMRVANALGVAATDILPGLSKRPTKARMTKAGLRAALQLAREGKGPGRPGLWPSDEKEPR